MIVDANMGPTRVLAVAEDIRHLPLEHRVAHASASIAFEEVPESHHLNAAGILMFRDFEVEARTLLLQALRLGVDRTSDKDETPDQARPGDRDFYRQPGSGIGTDQVDFAREFKCIDRA